ncbi:carboxylesterase family protein [Allokutzneria sp. NRRL B-24872]|uniref:carboxylesterase family protein n=1 Tax=Allokutzneria sp. NRRL B-24872 TaxID=1137961 RepID=UPI000A3C9637|nr:carboxylesterase family protein [Allokutzneria sp. NRRL B-24872]
MLFPSLFWARMMSRLLTIPQHRATTPEQRALSSATMRYWANFARGADPNGPGLPTWASSGRGEHVQELAPAQHKLGSWNGPNWPCWGRGFPW